MAQAPISGTFTGAGQSDAVAIRGKCNISLVFGGAVATVSLERSFDAGANWEVVSKDSTPAEASYTDNVSAVIEEVDTGVLYRWNCTSFTSGAVNYRIGRGRLDV